MSPKTHGSKGKEQVANYQLQGPPKSEGACGKPRENLVVIGHTNNEEDRKILGFLDFECIHLWLIKKGLRRLKWLKNERP